MSVSVFAPDVFDRWGRALLWSGLAAALGLVLWVAWTQPDYAVFLPALPLGALAGFYALRRFPNSLYLVLAGFVLMAGQEEGLQPAEILYALLYLGFLGYWIVSRLFFYRDELFRTPVDWAMGIFLVYAYGSTAWAIFFDFSLALFIGEAITLTMLFFYFPVREAVERHANAAPVLIGVVCWFALFTSIRNLFNFQQVLAQATYAWQITDGRVPLNEVFLMMGSLAAFTLFIYARNWRARLPLLGLFLVLFAGLIITQSRGYWAAFLLGGLVLFLAVQPRLRVRILLLVAGGLAGAVAIGYLLFPEFFELLVAGVIDRFASLGSATSRDISLVNRFYETSSVWERIQANPILGHGLGVRYEYFNIIYKNTRYWSFVHNGYAGLWYKFGLVGLGAMLFVWGASAWRGYRLFRRSHLPRLDRIAALIACSCLVGESLVANTSNPLMIQDATLMLALMTGLTAGLDAKAEALHHPECAS